MANIDPGLNQIITQIEFSTIHDDPQWGEFLERIGKSPGQLDAIEFQVTPADQGGGRAVIGCLSRKDSRTA